jgi:hypothetical protein
LIILAFLAPAGGGGLLAQELAPLTNIAAVKNLSFEAAARQRPARLRGVVTSIDPAVGDAFLQDASGAVYIGGSIRPFPAEIGDLVEVEGVTDPGGYAPMVIP